MGLKDPNVIKFLNYCPRCNSCKYLYRNYSPSCPAFEKFKWECYTASGKVWMARDIYEGKYPISESIRDKVFSCTMCGNCSEQCQQEISNHHIDVFEALREECIDAGLALPAHEAFHKNIEVTHNPYGDAVEKRFEGIDAKYFKDHAEVFFFVGCTTALRNRQLLMDVLAILDRLGVDFTLSKEEWCCGSPLLTTGQKKYAKVLAEHNTELIKKIAPKTIITACAGCFRSLKGQYPEKFELSNSSVEIVHISQFLNRILKSNVFTNREKIRVTYHDPCHLGRHMEVFEEPRQVIKKMKNVEMIEMPRNRKNAWCCGAGAGVKSAFKDWSLEIAETRVIEALALADAKKGPIRYIVTTCPFCERNLGDAIVSLRQKHVAGADNIDLIDLMQLVKQRMGI